MISKFCCALVLPFVLAAAADDEQPGLAEFQGVWRLASAVSESGEAEVPEPGLAIVVKKDRVLYGGEEIAVLLAKADANDDAKLREIDFHFGEKERVFEGVCAIETEKLKVCLNQRSGGLKERPDGFALDGHPSWGLLTFEKSKENEKEMVSGPGFVGLALRFEEETKEVVIADVLDSSPARKAGLVKDDVLLAVAGAEVTGMRQAVQAVRRAKPGEDLLLRVRRAGKEQDEKVKVGLFPLSALLSLE